MDFIIKYLYSACQDKYFVWKDDCFRNIKLTNFPEEWYENLYRLDLDAIADVEETVENIYYCYNDFDNSDDCGAHYVDEFIERYLKMWDEKHGF